MRILGELGLDLAGYKWPWEAMEFDENINQRDRDRILNRRERTRDLNPGGFWEIPGVVIQGTREVPKEMDGKVAKIVTSGAYPRCENGRIFGTPPQNYERAVLCIRNPKSIAKSQTSLPSGVDESTEDNGWSTAQFMVSPKEFVSRTGNFLVWLSQQSTEVRDKFLVVDFDSLVKNPDHEIKRISNHAEVPFSKTDIVDKKLRRSVLEEWPDEVAEVGALADKLYELTLTRKWDDISSVWRVEQFQWEDKMRREMSMWTDTEWGTYRLISPALWRGLRDNDKNVRDKLLKSKDFHNYTRSKYFEESSSTYTIERPHDMGDLTRRLVNCKHPNVDATMTHERFRALWKQWGRE